MGKTGKKGGKRLKKKELAKMLMELFQNNELDDFTYNKALQKCRESFRVSDADKALLQNMKRK